MRNQPSGMQQYQLQSSKTEMYQIKLLKMQKERVKNFCEDWLQDP